MVNENMEKRNEKTWKKNKKKNKPSFFILFPLYKKISKNPIVPLKLKCFYEFFINSIHIICY